jgi:hypothetical protein
VSLTKVSVAFIFLWFQFAHSKSVPKPHTRKIGEFISLSLKALNSIRYWFLRFGRTLAQIWLEVLGEEEEERKAPHLFFIAA